MFHLDAAGAVQHRIASPAVRDAVVGCWTASVRADRKFEWRLMAYVIDGVTFDNGLTYPDQVDPSELQFERRPRMVSRYFGAAEVNYDDPDN